MYTNSVTLLRNVNEEKVREYILAHIDLDGYENQTLPENPVLACYEIFQMEYGWRSTQRGMNETSAFTEWLKGLPCLSVAFTYYEERELVKTWRKRCRKCDIEDDDWVNDNYWDIITAVFFKMYNEAKRKNS